MPQALRLFLSLVLLLSMVPAAALPEAAYASTYYSHGTISVSSADAEGSSIDLEVGEQATISVYPYQHVQYKGCCMDRCLDYGCDDMAGYVGACFKEGLGCKCDSTPTLRQTVIDPSLTGDQVVSISGVSASSTLTASTANLGQMNTGTITLTATEAGSGQLTVAASMEDCGMWNPSTVTYTVNVTDPNAGADDDEEDTSSITGTTTIKEGGAYTLAAGLANATITVATTEPVEFVGNGIGGGAANYVTIDSTVPGANVTLNNVVMYTATDHPTNALRFTGANNTLTLKGQNQIQVCYNQGSDMALIRVPKDAGLTINGDGELYMLKHSYGAAGIGGNEGEPCGNITLDGPSIYATGVNGGCIIGSDSTAQQSGKFSLNAGELAVHPADWQPALCGFSQVALNGGTLSVVMGANARASVAPAIASYDGQGAGTLIFNGGLVRMQPASNFDVASVDNGGNATKPLFIDPASIAGTADSYQISLDGKQVYSGDMIVSLHKGSVDDAFATNPNTWAKALSTEYYLLATPESHTIDVNGKTLYVAYEEGTGFTTSTEPPASDEQGEPALVDGVYQIATEAQLRWFADAASEDGTLSAALVADIALQDGTLPIIAGAYSGTFDGQGHAITGITALSSVSASTGTNTYSAFIYNLVGGTVRGLTLEGSASTDSTYAAAFTVTATDATIQNCTNRVSLTLGGTYIGGIVARVTGSAASVDGSTVFISGCRNEGAVLSTRASGIYAGGILGGASTSTTTRMTLLVSDCENAGVISLDGKGYAGGIMGGGIGVNCAATMERCANSGDISMAGPTTTTNVIGGITASASPGTAATAPSILFADCYNSGTLSMGAAKGYVGGVVGTTSTASAVTLSRVHNVGAVSGGAGSGAILGVGSNSSVEDAYYLAGSCEGATLARGAEVSAEEMASLATVLDCGRGVWVQGEAYPVLGSAADDEPALLVPDAAISTSALRLRHNGNGDDEPSWAQLALTNADPEWAAAVTGIKVTSAVDESYSVQVARADAAGTKPAGGSFSFNSDEAPATISIGRNASNPVFVVNPGEGEPFDVPGMRGTITYPQSQVYTVSIEAEGYEPVTADITFYTGASDDFTIWMVEDEGADPEPVATLSGEEIAKLSSFANGSSQCGMTGFRTFSAVGASIADILEYAQFDVSEDDAFKLQTTDNFGSMFTYDQLFGERYFLQSVYDDPEVAEVYNRLASDASAGSDTELRRLLASKAKDAGTIARPMISANYAETMISGEQVGNTPVPTEENTFIDALTGAENQYRFTYGIALVQEDETVTFVTGDDATEVAPQKVKSHLMTSTENTTIKSTYWNNGLIIYRGQGSEPAESDAADAIVKPADPTREGYEFAGWYTDEACTDGNEFDFEANDGTVDANTTLYAKWVEAEKTPELVDGAYVLTNQADLVWFAAKAQEDPTVSAVLANDITLEDGILPNLAPIATNVSNADKGFAGTFDGAGHAILGVTGFANAAYPGLVGILSGGTIKDLTIKGMGEPITVTGSAGVFAITSYGGAIEGCTNEVSLSGAKSMGGILYSANRDTKVTGCVNKGSLRSTYTSGLVGGIVATNAVTTDGQALTIERCVNEGDVSAAYMGGGIVGKNGGVLAVSESCNLGSVSDSSKRTSNQAMDIGGIVGCQQSTRPTSITDCYNAGDVSVTLSTSTMAIAGGIIGYAQTGSPVVTDCFTTGAVNTFDGFAGASGTFTGKAQNANMAPAAENSYYLAGVGNGAMAGADLEGASAVSAEELLYLADDLGDPFVNDAITGHPVFSWQDHEEPAPLPQTFPITYVLGADDAVNAESNPAEYTEGDEVAFADPVREGFEFAGWFADEALTQQVSGITADQTGEVTVYAKWLDYGNLSVELSNGDQGYQYVATTMGRDPAAQVGYDLLASFDGADEMDQALQVERMQAWLDAVNRVTIGEGDDAIVLENKALADWMGEIADPATDVLNYYSFDKASVKTVRDPETQKYVRRVGSKVNVPIQLFGTDEYSTLKITFSAEGYEDMTGEMVYRNLGATQIVVRVKDSATDEPSYTYTLSMDDLKALPVQSGVQTSANCGMAGLRSYMAEGVALTDVLKAAGVEFGPGMGIQLRVTDYATTNDGNGGLEDAYGTYFDYETLMGVDRYHYPAMWDDQTVYEELDGKTIYEVISQNMSAWKYGNDDTLKKLLATGAQKVESPIIAWAWNEGVVAWGGTNPATQTWGSNTYNPYTSHETFRFLYGMKMDEDGSIADEFSTAYNTYGLFGIDIIANGQSAVDTTFNVTGIDFALPENASLDAEFDVVAALRDLRLGGTVQLPTASSTDPNTTFNGWFLDGKQVTALTRADLEGHEGVVMLGSSWLTKEEPSTDGDDQQGGNDNGASSGSNQNGPSQQNPQIVYVPVPQPSTGSGSTYIPQSVMGAAPLTSPAAAAEDEVIEVAAPTAPADRSAVIGEREVSADIDDEETPLAETAEGTASFMLWDLWPLFLALLIAAGVIAGGIIWTRKKDAEQADIK